MTSIIRLFTAFSFMILLTSVLPLNAPAFPEMAEKGAGGELTPLSNSGMAGGILFQAPDAWKPSQPTSSMRLYQFEIPAAKDGVKSAELAVFHFPGTGGDVTGNIERWKQQFTSFTEGFTPEEKKENVNNLPVSSVYIEGTLGSGMPGMPTEPQSGYAVLGAVVEGPQGPVFFKMMGPAETVKGAKENFSKLIQSFKTHP